MRAHAEANRHVSPEFLRHHAAGTSGLQHHHNHHSHEGGGLGRGGWLAGRTGLQQRKLGLRVTGLGDTSMPQLRSLRGGGGGAASSSRAHFEVRTLPERLRLLHVSGHQVGGREVGRK